MKLTQVEIVNFRSIKYYEFDFKYPLQTLVGINESGKSNILKALSLLDKDVPISQDDVRDQLHEEDAISEAYIDFVFSWTESERRDLCQEIEKVSVGMDGIITHKGVRLSLAEFIALRPHVIYRVDLLKQARRTMYYSVNSDDELGLLRGLRKVSDELYASAQVPKNVKYVTASPEDSEGISKTASVTIDEVNDFIGSFYVKKVSDSLPKCIFWSYKEEFLLPGRVDFHSFKDNPSSCEPLRVMFSLAGYNSLTEDFAYAEARTNGLKNMLKRVSAIATEHLNTVWPEWNNIKVEVVLSGTHLDAGLEDKNNFYSLSRRSDGFKRFFTFLILISGKAKARNLSNNLILIDEPEIGIHPSGQIYLLDELKKIARDNNVVISTHSIFLIDRDLIDRHLLVKRHGEITQIERAEISKITDEEVVYKSLNFSIFELLRKCNVIFEGWRDKQIFRIYTRMNHPSSAALGLLHAEGVSGVNRVAGMCENFSREYIVVSDSDKPAIDQRKLFSRKERWFTYAEFAGETFVTSEDFISVSAVNNVFESVCKTYGVPSLQLESQCVGGYMQAIQKHVRKHAPSEEKSILSKIKDEIVFNLKASDILTDYEKVVTGILKNVLPLDSA